jgi:hypothetical protein
MKTQKLLRQTPWLLLILVGGIAIAQSATTGRVFPYVGYLEEDGFPVDGSRDVRINLFSSEGAGTACQTQDFDDVLISSGRFQVDLIDVFDNCLVTGELFADIAVGPDFGSLVDLSTGVGSGRVQIGSVPFAAASPKAATLLVEDDLVVLGNTSTPTLDVTSNTTAALDVTGNTRTGSLTVTGNATAAGTALLSNGGHAGYAGFSHVNNTTGTEYALLQSADGSATFMNAAPGGALYFRTGNTDRMTLSSAGNLNVTGRVTAANMFGTPAAYNANQTYTAGTDGFVTVFIGVVDTGFRCGTYAYAYGTTESVVTSGAAVNAHCSAVDYPNVTDGFTMPVRRGQSWRVDYAAFGAGLHPIAVRFVPLGG